MGGRGWEGVALRPAVWASAKTRRMGGQSEVAKEQVGLSEEQDPPHTAEAREARGARAWRGVAGRRATGSGAASVAAPGGKRR